MNASTPAVPLPQLSNNFTVSIYDDLLEDPRIPVCLSVVIDKGNKIKVLCKFFDALLPNERPGEHCLFGEV